MSVQDLASTFDPLACEKNSEPLPADLVPRIAERVLESGSQDLPKLRAVLDAAFKHKMTSVEEIDEELGPKAAAVAKGKKNPDPVTYRAVLGFVASLEVA